MAAGEGRRLRPLTERWPKPVLPIEGRPVVATLLHELARAGLARAWVVTGHLAEQVERLVGDGTAFGLEVRFARQPEALGSADAVARALAAGATPPLLAVAADTVFAGGTIGETLERWCASGTLGGLAVRPVPLEELPDRSAVRVEEGRLLGVVEKPAVGPTQSPLAGAPLWFLGEELCADLVDLPGPPYELATAAQQAIERGLALAALEIGPTRDLTRPEDVVLENFPYLLGGR